AKAPQAKDAPPVESNLPVSSPDIDLANAARISSSDSAPIIAEVVDSGTDLDKSGVLSKGRPAPPDDEVIDLNVEGARTPPPPARGQSSETIDLHAAGVVFDQPISAVSEDEAIELGAEALVHDDEPIDEGEAIELDAAAVVGEPSSAAALSDGDAIDL